MSYDVGKPSGCPVKKMSYDVDIPLAQYSRHILQYWIDATANVWIMATRSPPFFPSRVVDRNPSGTAPKVQLSWRRRGTHRSFFEAANDRNVITTWVARDPNNLNFFKEIQLRQQKMQRLHRWRTDWTNIGSIFDSWSAFGQQETSSGGGSWWPFVTSQELVSREGHCSVQIPWRCDAVPSCRGEKNAWLNHPLGEMVLECWRWKKWVTHIQVEAAFPLSGVAPQGGEVVGVINLVTNAFSAVKVMKSWCFDSVFLLALRNGSFWET